MEKGLSIKFNHKAPREIKTENDIKVGVRKRADGSVMYVRAGKIIGGEEPKRKHEEILNEYRSAAAEATAKKNLAAQEHHRPKFITAFKPTRSM